MFQDGKLADSKVLEFVKLSALLIRDFFFFEQGGVNVNNSHPVQKLAVIFYRYAREADTAD